MQLVFSYLALLSLVSLLKTSSESSVPSGVREILLKYLSNMVDNKDIAK